MRRMSKRRGRLGRMMAGTAMGVAAANAPAHADPDPHASTPEAAGEQILVEGSAPEGFKAALPNLSKLTEPLVDTPQSIDVLSKELLQARAVTNLNDALRTVPGISLGAGEFSWQGNNPTIRGFLARNDMFLDGMRDFGSYYRDPFNAESVDVLMGPASVLFGRGSTGGVVNQATKLPQLRRFANGTLVGGTDLTRRATIDVNEPVEELGESAAFRINAMVHAQDVAERDVAKQSRFGVAPSLALGIGKPTRLTVSYLDQNASDVPDYGVPWLGTRPAPVPRDTFYGFRSDSLKTGTHVATARLEHDVTPALTVRETARYSHYTRSFRISEPIIMQPDSTPPEQVDVGFNIWSGDSVETMAWNQLEGVARFETGGVRHTLVVGIEGGRETSSPRFDNSAGVPTVPLLAPDPDRLFNAASTFPRLVSSTTAWSFAPYAIETAKLGERWEVSGGLRWDYFKSHYRADRYSTMTPGELVGGDDVERTDRAPSYRAAVVYKPPIAAANGTIYAAYGTSFNPSAETLSQITSGRGLGIGNADLAPERNKSYELGTKWDVLDGALAVTGAVFRLEKDNARVPDPDNAGFNILAGEQRVDGFSAGVVGRVTEAWQITAGFAYLDGKVTRSVMGAVPVGAPLPNTPRVTFGAFTAYKLGGRFEVGAGTQHASARYAQNTAPLRAVPGYWTFDAMARGALSERLSLQLNVINVLDALYYDQIHPWHVVPGVGRTALLTVAASY